jgi:group I intron endonuclease
MIGIYCITNNINGKRYIGQSWNITDRLQSHRYKLNNGTHHNQHLKSAWAKYGSDNFKIEVIRTISENKLTQVFLDTFEQYYINLYKCRDNSYGYNKREAGVCGRMSDETKKKISESEKGRPSPTKGMKFSDETRAKMSESRKGKPTPMAGLPAWNKGLKGAQVAWNKGKKMSHPVWNKGKPGRKWTQEEIAKREATKKAKRESKKENS